MGVSAVSAEARLYLDLMKKCLTNSIYGEKEYIEVAPAGRIKQIINKAFNAAGVTLVRTNTYSCQKREKGLDWPPYAHTMIGLARLNNLQECVEEILRTNVRGDLIETGVWRGGATIFMRAILRAYNVNDRYVWVADSFQGLPVPNPIKFPEDEGDRHHTVKELAISLEEVKGNFGKYDLLDDQVRFLKGWFSDTLPQAEIRQLALIRLDGDMYESTMDALVNLYPKLSLGGYVIVDDWGAVDACRRAIEDYRTKHAISDEIHPIDGKGVYWKRSG